MTVARSLALFAVAALFEIGGAWLVWQGIREHKGWIWIGAGVIALGLYGVVASFQSDDDFGRVLAAYGGIFVAGSIAWGMVADGYRPDRYDVIGALISVSYTHLDVYKRQVDRLGHGRRRLPPRPVRRHRRPDLPRRDGRDHVRAPQPLIHPLFTVPASHKAAGRPCAARCRAAARSP